MTVGSKRKKWSPEELVQIAVCRCAPLKPSFIALEDALDRLNYAIGRESDDPDLRETLRLVADHVKRDLYLLSIAAGQRDAACKEALDPYLRNYVHMPAPRPGGH